MADFDKAFQKVIKKEGGYIKDKDDAGGETYLGVSRKYHKDSEMWKYIDEVTKNNPNAVSNKITNILKTNKELDNIVKEIYRKQYWDKLKCYFITSQKLAEQLFDMAVNAGITTAIKLMQRIIGCKETGIMSDKFINSINEAARLRKHNKI